jgi:hypothetical protein
VALVALIFLLPWRGAALLPCLRPLVYVHTLNLDDPEEVNQEIQPAFEVSLRVLSR